MPFYDSFPPELCRLFQAAALKEDSLEELRLRVGQPLALRYRNCEYGITGDGKLTENLMKSVRIDAVQLEAVLEALSACSLYAFAEETRQGFFTVPGGHRVGIAGKTVLENGKVSCIRNISFLNLRFSHEKKDALPVSCRIFLKMASSATRCSSARPGAEKRHCCAISSGSSRRAAHFIPE